MEWEVCVNALPRKCLWLSWNDSPASTSSPVTYPCNLTKSLWSHRPRKKKWKKLDGKRLIFHLTQYLQQNWWYHKEMIVCINRNKIQKCRTGNLERRVRAELTLNVGDVASPTWHCQRLFGVLSFFCEKICDPKMPTQKRWQISSPNIGDMKSKDSALTLSTWQRHLFVCRFSLILVYNLGSKHFILFDPNISNFFRCEWCVDSVTYYPTLTRYTGSPPCVITSKV